MSLTSSKRETSKSQKFLRSKSAEMRKKMSFSKEEGNQLSINTILEQTLKSANQSIHPQQANYRQSMFTASKQSEEPQQSGNNNKPEVFCWEITKIEEKRKIKGIKAKFTWCSNKQSNFITTRVILTDNYNRMNQPEYFIELDSANVDLTLEEQKSIQKYINKLIEDEQNKTEQLKNQVFFWLKAALVSMHNLFMSMKLNQRKKVKEVEFKRFAINKNYMLYPCPASISWSPHGMLCLTQNKVGTLSKPIVGNIYSYRNLIEAPYKFQRFSRKNNEIDDLKMVEQRREEEEETTEAQFFGWDVKEEINFSIFGKLTEEGAEQPNSSESPTQNQNEKNDKRILKEHETFYIGNTHNIPPKLEKIYRRHFSNPGENTQFQFLEKLKIFTVKNQIAELEDGIMYLVDKIQKHNRAGVIEALLQNQFTGYHGAFNKSSKEQPTFQKLRYELITQFLQEKIKSTPQSQHFLYMKSVMIENEFFRLALESYFRENFAKLQITQVKYERLGTFDNFDEFSSEKALFSLLEELLKAEKNLKDAAQKIKTQYKQKPDKYDDPKYRQKKYAKMIEQNIEMKLLLRGYVKKGAKGLNNAHESLANIKFLKSQSGIQIQHLTSQKLNRQVNLNLMPFLVVNRVEFSPLQFNMILTPNQRRNFLETVIPILWIKDRSSEKFQYKQAKRVIIANSKIINFLEKLNNIGVLWKKIETGRKSTFLKTMIREYRKFEKKSEVPLGKIYRAYCQGCTDDFTAYNIEELFRVTRCSRCKYLQGVS